MKDLFEQIIARTKTDDIKWAKTPKYKAHYTAEISHKGDSYELQCFHSEQQEANYFIILYTKDPNQNQPVLVDTDTPQGVLDEIEAYIQRGLDKINAIANESTSKHLPSILKALQPIAEDAEELTVTKTADEA